MQRNRVAFRTRAQAEAALAALDAHLGYPQVLTWDDPAVVHGPMPERLRLRGVRTESYSVVMRERGGQLRYGFVVGPDVADDLAVLGIMGPVDDWDDVGDVDEGELSGNP